MTVKVDVGTLAYCYLETHRDYYVLNIKPLDPVFRILGILFLLLSIYIYLSFLYYFYIINIYLIYLFLSYIQAETIY